MFTLVGEAYSLSQAVGFHFYRLRRLYWKSSLGRVCHLRISQRGGGGRGMSQML